MNTRTVVFEALADRAAAVEKRRFPVSVSSEAPVPRRDWQTGQTFKEILRHTPDAVDLSRAPLPVLEGHDRSKAPVGIVTDLRVDGGKLRGFLQLGASARAGELAADIAAGIVRNVSVGYSVETEERDEQALTITATRWTPHEASIVAVPADSTVGIGRSKNMDPENTSQPAPDDTATRAVEAERIRAATITALCQRSGLDTLGAELVRDGTPLEKARERILDALATRDEQIRTEQHLPVAGTFDGLGPQIRPAGGDDYCRAAIDALLLRSGVPVAKPHAAAGDVSASVYDIARLCLSRADKSTRGLFGGGARGPKLLERAMSTSDFPSILSGALHASVRSGYETEPASHRAWVRAVPVPDFRLQHRPILGSAPALAQVNEGGEYTHGSMEDDSTSYRVAKYGRIVALSWESIINDNLGAFLRVQPALGQAARRAEADAVYALLAENTTLGPTMQDGTVLFHENHGNLADECPTISVDVFSAGRTLLRRQTALGGGHLSLVPRFLIVPPEYESSAELIIANATRHTTTERTSPEWVGNLALVVEPRLTEGAVVFAASYDQIDTVELGLLEENLGGPVLEEEREFDRDVLRWKVRHVFGAKALDWRGLARVPVTTE